MAHDQEAPGLSQAFSAAIEPVMIRMRVLAATCAAVMAWVLSVGDVRGGLQPIKVGLSMALAGAIAVNGKQPLTALEIWRNDVTARCGLLGRPVELVCYDDQSTPAERA